MILVYGDPEDDPTAAVLHACRSRRLRHALVDETRPRDTVLRLDASASGVRGTIEHAGWAVALDDVSGVYYRPTAAHTSGADFRVWTELTGVPVANRASAMASNGSKPFQLLLIAPYFAVPPTIVTNDPRDVRVFLDAHGSVVYKSCSGVRSIVQELDEAALARLDAIRWCPTQFQARIGGSNVRVHVVGREIFATIVRSKAVDYRYAVQQVGAAAELEPIELPSDVAARCVALCGALGLVVAGIDLMQTPSKSWVCFEVNPSPGFTFFEDRTGQPIADAIVQYLAGITEPRRVA